MKKIKCVADIDSRVPTIEERLEELKRKHGDRIHVKKPYKVTKVISMKNGCCEDLPVFLTANYIKNENRWNYSCQCACDGWCTTGCNTPEEAIDHYRRMSKGENLYGGVMNYVI